MGGMLCGGQVRMGSACVLRACAVYGSETWLLAGDMSFTNLNLTKSSEVSATDYRSDLLFKDPRPVKWSSVSSPLPRPACHLPSHSGKSQVLQA